MGHVGESLQAATQVWIQERQKSWLHPEGDTAKQCDLEGEDGTRDFLAEGFDGEFVDDDDATPTPLLLVLVLPASKKSWKQRPHLGLFLFVVVPSLSPSDVVLSSFRRR